MTPADGMWFTIGVGAMALVAWTWILSTGFKEHDDEEGPR